MPEQAGQAVRRRSTPQPLVLQRALTVGAADDPFEREADRAARQVVDMLHGHGASPSFIPAASGAGRIRRSSGADATVVGREGGVVHGALESRIRAAGSGRALESGLRRSMETAFGADFGSVRVHTDSAVAPQIGATAFTHGSDIHFASGTYEPGTPSGQRLIAHELTHTLQQGAAVERKTIRRREAELEPDYWADHMEADKARRSKLDWIPSTGLGRFDAEYLPRAGELKITLRPFLEFCQKVNADDVVPGGWTDAEKQKFFADFKQQAEAAWSGKYTFACTKDRFTQFAAKVIIDVQQSDNVKTAHFHHRIAKEKGAFGTGIGREQGEQTPTDRKINQGNFLATDATVRPHDSKSTCGGIASHDQERITHLLKGHKAMTITFEGGSTTKLSSASKAALDAFALGMQETGRPGSVPIPILAHGKENKRERGKSSTHGADRAAAVVAYLGPKLAKNPVVVGKNFSVMVDEQKTEMDSKNSKLSKDAEKVKYDALKGRRDHREVELEVDPNFTWTGDPYSILAHEFGHMLGNPDEYFDYGSAKVRDSKARQLLESGRAEDAIASLQISKLKPSGTEGHIGPQEGAVDLALASGQKIPTFGPKTSSIMSAGADVLPVHYAPLWEVLGAITAPSIAKTDWKIV